MIEHVKRIFFAMTTVLIASIVALSFFYPRPVDVDIHPNEQLTVDNASRNYRIVIPHTLLNPAPVVFAFHGIGDSTESMADYSRLDQLASCYGFILVYPAARKSMWATTDATPDNLDTNPDVRFFDQLLIHLADNYEIDLHRIYAIGMSNGATFVQLLAIARPNDIAAIVAHSGTKPRDLSSSANRLPIMLLVGVNDSASSAIQSDADQYRSDGQVVEYILVPALAHEWSVRHNNAMWEFLSQHPRNREP